MRRTPNMGRWNGIDQLAESYLGTSPNAYVLNNPISLADPDGRLAMAPQDPPEINVPQGSLWFYNRSLHGSVENYLGMDGFVPFKIGSSGGGGGGSSTFGQTQAYRDLMASFENGQSFNLTNKNGYMKWWTGTATQTSYRIGDDLYGEGDLGVMHSMKLNSDTSWDAYKNWADYGSGTISTMYQAVADQRTALYNRGYWIDNLGNQRSVAYAGRARGSLIGLRADYVRTTAKFTKYAERAGYVGYALSAYEVGEGLSNDGWRPRKNTTVAAARVGTGLAVSYASGAGATWLTGAIAGAFGGSVAPGVGTVIGFVVGGVAGYLASDYVGEAVENSYK